jgi:hypothetical protein
MQPDFGAEGIAWKGFFGVRRSPAIAVSGSGTTCEADTDVVALGVLMRF